MAVNPAGTPGATEQDIAAGVQAASSGEAAGAMTDEQRAQLAASGFVLPAGAINYANHPASEHLATLDTSKLKSLLGKINEQRKARDEEPIDMTLVMDANLDTQTIVTKRGHAHTVAE